MGMSAVEVLVPNADKIILVGECVSSSSRAYRHVLRSLSPTAAYTEPNGL